MKRFLQSWWGAAAVGAVVYLSLTAWLLRPATLKRIGLLHLAQRQPPAIAPLEPSWNFKNPEMDQWLSELKQEREELKLREQQLRELELRLQAERQEILSVTQAVHRMQSEFDQFVVRIKDEEFANLKKLGKVYANMSPQGAATILKELSDEQIVRILMHMRENETAPILENLGRSGTGDAKRAALVSDRLRLAISETKSAKLAVP